jgi:hypothetical protein
MFNFIQIRFMVENLNIENIFSLTYYLSALTYYALSMRDILVTQNFSAVHYSVVIDTTFSMIGVTDVPDHAYNPGNWRLVLNLLNQGYIMSYQNHPAVNIFGYPSPLGKRCAAARGESNYLII